MVIKNKKEKTQINNNFSSEKKVITGALQGSTDGPLTLNLFIIFSQIKKNCYLKVSWNYNLVTAL